MPQIKGKTATQQPGVMNSPETIGVEYEKAIVENRILFTARSFTVRFVFRMFGRSKNAGIRRTRGSSRSKRQSGRNAGRYE